MGWGGVGDVNLHVHVTLMVLGWGGMSTFMFMLR